MKRVISFVVILVLCAAMVCPALAVGDDFTGSIAYKPVPPLVGTETEEGTVVGYLYEDEIVVGDVIHTDGRVWVYNVHDENVADDHVCLVITPVSEAESSTMIPDDAREQLLWAYQDIVDNGMSVFANCKGLNESIAAALGEGKTVEDMVVKDLFDVSVICDELEEFLEPEGTTICLDFDFGIQPGTHVEVVAYKNGEWQMIEDVAVKGDGSITCTVYENFCPVAVLVPASNSIVEAPQTGDSVGTDAAQWGVIMAVCLLGIAAIVLFMRKRKVTDRG